MVLCTPEGNAALAAILTGYSDEEPGMMDF